jgi:exopolysaccharide production protein ExoY
MWKGVGLAERVAAVLALTVSAPVLLIAAIGIVAISRHSPFVAHLRVGREGRPIWILKLRTMWSARGERPVSLVQRLPAPELSSEAARFSPKLKNAGVTSRFAAFCRRHSIDELPQFWNIARGEMALVGPRPITRQELDLFYGSAAAYILSAKPGLSGLWQISGRSRLTYSQRRRLDLFMIHNWSFPLYLRILFLTFPRVLAGKDAW